MSAESQAVAEQGRRLRNAVVWVLAAAALAVALVLAVPDLRDVGRRIVHMDARWLLLALAFELLACAGYVLVVRLVFPTLSRRLARRLAWAELAFGAALPVGGVGSLAFGAWVLRREGMGARELAERSAVLYLLTSGVNLVVLAVCGLGLGLGVLSGPDRVALGLVPAGVAVAVLALALASAPLAAWLAGRMGTRAGAALTSFAAAVAQTRRFLVRPSWGLLGALVYLLADVAVLWTCARALGNEIPAAPLVLAYQLGLLATWLPIPGGVGALDGGIIGMLLLYDAPAATAAAAVLVYHALMFWTRTLLGSVAFLLLRRELRQAPPSGLGGSH